RELFVRRLRLLREGRCYVAYRDERGRRVRTRPRTAGLDALRGAKLRHQSRHQRWYRRHHAASKARSALRGWALRNRTRELVESGIALGSICLRRDLTVALHTDAQAQEVRREERTVLLRDLEAGLVEGRTVDAKEG